MNMFPAGSTSPQLSKNDCLNVVQLIVESGFSNSSIFASFHSLGGLYTEPPIPSRFRAECWESAESAGKFLAFLVTS